MIATILGLIISLSILIFVHELGHYAAAKLSGIVVEEFGFGYPPRLLAFWRTKGKIVIDGQEIVIPRSIKLPEGLQARSAVRYETETDSKGRLVLTRIQEVDPAAGQVGSGGYIEFLDPGTVFSLNAIPFGGFAKMLGEEDPTFPGSLASKSKRTRVFVLSAGALMNLLTAVLFFALAFALGGPAIADPQNAVVTTVAPGSPAEEVGLQPNDVILQADGVEILAVADLPAYVQEHLGEPIRLTVRRGDEIIEISVTPRLNPPPGEGAIGIGLAPRTTVQRYPLPQALWMGLQQTVRMAGFIFTVPIQIIKGLIPAELARPVGPVGVGQMVGDAVNYSLDTGWWFPVMQLMGSLSVALAVTNLLPLPGLDGGRILFIIVEGVRGRRVDPAKEGLVHLIGMAFLVALMLLITWQDLVNPLPAVDWSSLF